ncbi:MAG: hypothetical protein GKS06_02705 [Acidobacteria bacterium]|nr:hypothetical protein [Acidobacteriota bacterium]
MKSKLFVAALLLVAIGTAGVAHAQPSVANFNIKKDGVKYFNVTIGNDGPIDIVVQLKSQNTDVDIYLFDADDDSRDAEDAIGRSIGTTGGFEKATISDVKGKTIVICIVHVSGPNSKADLRSSVTTGLALENGNVRLGSYGGSTMTDGGDFDLYGSVEPEMAGIQAALQQLVAQKR